MVIDPEGRIAFANAECEALLNLSERAMRGQPLDSVLTPPGEPSRRDNQGFSAFDAEIEIARSGRIMVDYIEARVPDHAGWRSVTLHHGATSRRMGQSVDRASAARAAIGAAAMLAHEIKNPLSGIRGAAQLIAGDGDGTEELTTLITTEVDRIAALIDRMQDFTDTRPLSLNPENIYPLLDHARRVALAGFARHVTIDERFDPSLPPVMTDQDAILQVVLNLIKNATEAMVEQADARITLATAYRHGMAVSPSPEPSAPAAADRDLRDRQWPRRAGGHCRPSVRSVRVGKARGAGARPRARRQAGARYGRHRAICPGRIAAPIGVPHPVAPRINMKSSA